MREKFRKSVPAVFLLVLLLLAGGARPVRAASNEETAFKYFTQTMRLPASAACGIMANIERESGFIADINGLGGAYGICQWVGIRQTRLKDYCGSKGLSYRTINGQLHYLEYELKTWFPGVLTYMKGVSNTASGAYNAGYYWCKNFEMPGDLEATSANRGTLAKNTYWPKYGTTVVHVQARNIRNGIRVETQNAGKYGFNVYRYDSSSKSYKKLGKAAAGKTTFVDTTCTKVGKKYYYYVVPLDKSGKEGSPSMKASRVRHGSINHTSCSISLAKSSVLYTGKRRCTKVTVTYGGKKLTKGTDYKLSWANNLHAGTAKVKVTGIGNYFGERTLTYKIRRRAQVITANSHKVTYVKNKEYKLKASADGGGELTFTSSAPKVIEVKDNRLYIRGKGTAYIKITAARTKDYKKAEKTVRIRVVAED